MMKKAPGYFVFKDGRRLHKDLILTPRDSDPERFTSVRLSGFIHATGFFGNSWKELEKNISEHHVQTLTAIKWGSEAPYEADGWLDSTKLFFPESRTAFIKHRRLMF